MRVTYSIFPKFYKHLDVAGLAALVAEVGLDTTNLVIRRGYWVEPDRLAEDVPAFVRAMEREGVAVRFATAGSSAEEVAADPEPLRILAASGITDFRMGYFRGYEGTADLRASLDEARQAMERMVPVLEKVGIRAVYQVHHGTLVPGPSAVWPLVRGLPPERVGVMLDPGNQTFEGLESWDRSAKLLGDHLVAVGVKDTALVRDPDRAAEPGKGWRREWAPCDEGVVNWHDLARALKAVDFEGTFVWQPFYNENEPEVMTEKLKRGVAYVRRAVEEVENEEA